MAATQATQESDSNLVYLKDDMDLVEYKEHEWDHKVPFEVQQPRCSDTGFRHDWCSAPVSHLHFIALALGESDT